VKDFNQKQLNFVQSMGRGFQQDQSLDALPWVAGALLIFVLFVVALSYAIKKRYAIRGRLQYFYRKLKGEPVKDFRFSKSAEVVIQMPFGPERIARANTRNVSRSGMYVRLNPPLKKGDIFQFLLVLSEKLKIKGMAEVVWIQTKWTEHHPSGMGCRFKSISEEDRNRIHLFLRKN
jgi:hypothetical protein